MGSESGRAGQRARARARGAHTGVLLEVGALEARVVAPEGARDARPRLLDAQRARRIRALELRRRALHQHTTSADAKRQLLSRQLNYIHLLVQCILL